MYIHLFRDLTLRYTYSSTRNQRNIFQISGKLTIKLPGKNDENRPFAKTRHNPSSTKDFEYKIIILLVWSIVTVRLLNNVSFKKLVK